MLIERAAAREGCTTIAAIWNDVLSALKDHGISQVIYICVDANRQNPFVLTNVPDVYATADPTTDPFLSHIYSSNVIMPTGADYLPDYDYLPGIAKGLHLCGEKSRLAHGVGHSDATAGSDRHGGFNLVTRLVKPTFKEKIMPMAEAFRAFCLLAHRRIAEVTAETGIIGTDGFSDLLVAPQTPGLSNLSPREREVIYLVSQGVSRKECAKLCGISPNTVAEYTKSAYRKLGVSNRAEAANIINRTVG